MSYQHDLSADPDRAAPGQQVIPLLPFGYATDSVDPLSRDPVITGA
jgi:hypothetical protein